MSNMIPIGFEGTHHSHILAIDLMADSWNDERMQPNETHNRVFDSLCARESANTLDLKTERKLLERFKQGDIHARDALIWANLKSVRLIAHGFKSDTPDRSDMFSEGLVGLLKSMESFKLEYQFHFDSFAHKCIFYSIKNFLDFYGPGRICISSMRALKPAYLAFYNKYYQENHIPPSDDQVAQALQRINTDNVDELKRAFLRPVSLDSLCDSLGYNFVMEDLIGDFSDDLMGSISGDASDNIETILEKESLRQYIEEALANLDKREADVVRKYYGIGCDEHCLAQISAKYNMTSEGIRQILLRSIRKLRGLQGRPIRKYFYN